jgi:hypothetical protein
VRLSNYALLVTPPVASLGCFVPLFFLSLFELFCAGASWVGFFSMTKMSGVGSVLSPELSVV